MMKRRDFIKTIGASTILFNSNLVADTSARKNEKSVIMIYLSGGISATDFINPIPDAPVAYRSNRGSVKTKSGFLLGGDFQALANISENLSVVRNMNHRDANHESATGWVMTSEPHFQANEQKWPSYGAVAGYVHGTNNPVNGIPTYVKTNTIRYDDAAWIGSKYMGYDADAEGLKSMKINVPQTQFQKRLKMLSLLESNFDKTYGDELAREWVDLKEQAVNVIQGEASKAFDLSLEPDAALRQYGMATSSFGKNLLMSRRLVEYGARFVTVNYGGWDMHSDVSGGFARRGPELDKYVTVLIKDLKQRGMLDNTLIVICSEFSRTPKINTNAGRDHYPRINSLVFAGGGYDHGRVIGKTDKNATEVDGNPYGPEDMGNTILHHLGVDKNLQVTDNAGRPRYVYKQKSKNILLPKEAKG